MALITIKGMYKMNDIYLVLAVYDKSDITTGVSLYGVFHTKKEAKQYRKDLAYKFCW